MTKAYVINQVSFIYNDEIHHESEDGSGTPEVIYLDKKKAEKKLEKLNIQAFKGLNVSEYCYELDSMSDLSQEEIYEKFEKITGESIDSECIVPETLSDNQLKEVAEIFNKLRFYRIYEVDVI